VSTTVGETTTVNGNSANSGGGTQPTTPSTRRSGRSGRPEPVRRRVDWSWRHGPVIGPANVAGGVVSLAMLGFLAGVSPVWAAAAGIAAAAAAAGRAAAQGLSAGSRWWQAACGGTLVAALAAPSVRDREVRVQEERAEEARAVIRVQVAQEWEERLERVAQLRGVVILAVESWPQGGCTLDVQMPGRATLRGSFLPDTLNALAADARLPHGCTIEALPGHDQSRVLLRVPTSDAFADDVAYPDDVTPLSVTAELPIGVHRDWTTAGVSVLDDALITVGVRGTGKSNLLHVLISVLARCPDALVWVVDLNGAGLAAPWIESHLRRPDGRPVIDWVAPTAEEARLMTRTAIGIAMARKPGYAALMREHNDDKLPVSAQVPEIVVILDEGAEALSMRAGQDEILANFDKIISIGRAARVQGVFSALRATVETIGSANLKKQANNKLMTGATDPEEIAYLFGRSVTVPEVSIPGTVLMSSSRRLPTMAKAYRMTPDTIGRVVAATTHLRPALDALSVKAAGAAYVGRWARYRAWLAQTGADMPSARPTAPPANPSDRPGSGGMAGLSEATDHMNDVVGRLRAEAEAADRAQKGIQTDRPTAQPGQGQPTDRPTDRTSGQADRPDGMAALDDATDHMNDVVGRLRAEAEAADRAHTGQGPNDADIDAQFAAIAARWDDDGGGTVDTGTGASGGQLVDELGRQENDDEPATDAEDVARRALVLAVLEEAGPVGVHLAVIEDRLREAGYTVHKATMYRDLAAVGAGKADQRGWWAHPRHAA
jgi:hypothetical protein